MTDYSKLSERELDELVAERVMGWTKMATCFCGKPVGVPPGSENKSHTPEYSTDVTAALAVLEKLQPSVREIYVRQFSEGWQCTMSLGEGRIVVTRVCSMPRAACEAALSATEEPEA